MSLDERRRDALLALGMAEVRFDEPMAGRAWLQVGGPADALVDVAGLDDLRLLRRWARRERLALLPVPDGHGLLIRDGGLAGLVLRNAGDDPELVATINRLATWEDQGDGTGLPRGRARLFLDPDRRREASRLVADAGVAGIRLRGARISLQDPNVVVNEGTATAHDVLTLADWARRQVESRTGVKLALALQVLGRRHGSANRSPEIHADRT